VRKIRNDDDGGVVISFRVPAPLAAEIRIRAAEERRPVSQWLRNVIEDALRARKPKVTR
jgi:hypothetical protein